MASLPPMPLGESSTTESILFASGYMLSARSIFALSGPLSVIPVILSL